MNLLRYCGILLMGSFILIGNITYGQGTGLLMEDDVYENTAVIPNLGSKAITMPLKHSLKEYCPEVQNQGNIGSCTGWASGYGAFTIMTAQKEGNTDKASITENAFSALYLYNQAKLGECSQGAYFSKILQVLKEQGDCYSKDFDYPAENCDRVPAAELKETASSIEYVVKDYYTLFKSTVNADDKVSATKLSIAQNKPVIVGMLIRQNFKTLTASDKYWNPEAGNTGSAGGHAMVAVGYHDGKEAFLIMNSWGKYWGQDGFMWVKYEDFAKYCVYGYQLLVDKKKQKRTTTNEAVTTTEEIKETTEGLDMNAKFVFRKPDGWDDDKEEFVFKNVGSTFNGAYYKLNGSWKIGQQFQLMSEGITKDRYVYAFSIDAENEVKVHWPRHEQYGAYFEGKKESALVPYDDAQIIMPGAENVLVLNKEGSDYLFVLYSDREISDLTEKIEAIRSGEGSYMNRLETVFADSLVPSDDIQYNMEEMSFKANSKSGGYIIPIVLEVESK